MNYKIFELEGPLEESQMQSISGLKKLGFHIIVVHKKELGNEDHINN